MTLNIIIFSIFLFIIVFFDCSYNVSLSLSVNKNDKKLRTYKKSKRNLSKQHFTIHHTVFSIPHHMAHAMSDKVRRRIAENYMVVWVDASIDPSNRDCQNTLTQLRSVVNQVEQCTSAEQCIEQLEKTEETSFVISSGALGQDLVPDIHGMPKLDAIYIFCGNKQRHQQWAQNWPKIKGVHTSVKPICEALKAAINQCNQNNTRPFENHVIIFRA